MTRSVSGHGLGLPLVQVLYGVTSIVTEQSMFIGRWGMVDLNGIPAVPVGIAYLSLGASTEHE